jgi:hypothetical protein
VAERTHARFANCALASGGRLDSHASLLLFTAPVICSRLVDGLCVQATLNPNRAELTVQYEILGDRNAGLCGQARSLICWIRVIARYSGNE